MDTQSFTKALASITQDFWNTHQKPLLLSNLPSYVQQQNIHNYKEILGAEPLKAFVTKAAGPTTFQVVTHPAHKARIGLIPASETYTFPEEPAIDSPLASHTQPHQTNDAIALLAILSKLSDEELEKVVIPVYVLTRLYNNS